LLQVTLLFQVESVDFKHHSDRLSGENVDVDLDRSGAVLVEDVDGVGGSVVSTKVEEVGPSHYGLRKIVNVAEKSLSPSSV
jgi:hypothetical protein